MSDGKFFLGREYGMGEKALKEAPYLYDTEDLTTHAVVFGMTGSGKTGLCLDLLEEAVDEEIPIIAVDPKGDVCNLALLFPQLRGENFLPWVSPLEARKEGKTLDEYAAAQAAKWEKGLKDWGITSQRMEKIREKWDLRIYTPGSSAGYQVSILNGFEKPEGDFEEDAEGMVERIRNSVSALLALLNIDNDPLTSKPHILISNIIEFHWRLGRSLSIPDLILNIQKPPLKKLGVFDINQIMEEKERVDLSFQINNIIASPSFRFWTSGSPLSAGDFYSRSSGKTPVNIFYIAHLPDNERMFFTSLLLNEIVYWIRTQPGSPDLKYLFYMDEIFGYIPPYPKNPPSKNPLMLLMKQARAFGLGVVLGTQNPKDIDYKALTNTGTWFIGKLQAEGDRERVLEGMRGILDSSGSGVEEADSRNIISSLPKRVFLVKNVHAKGLKTFMTRWAMSYLAGPLTREQIKELEKGDTKPVEAEKEGRIPKQPPVDSRLLPFPPTGDVAVEFLYQTGEAGPDKYYDPSLYFEGEVIFDEHNLGIHARKEYLALLPAAEAPDWDRIEFVEKTEGQEAKPSGDVAGFAPLGAKLNYTQSRRLQSGFKDYLYSNFKLKLFINEELKTASEVDEEREAFRMRCRDVVEKMIDKEVERIKDTYDRKIQVVEDRIERERLKVEKYESELKSRKTEELLAAGESILGVLLGSKSRRILSTSARRRRMTSTAKSRMKLGQDTLAGLMEDLKDLQEELEDKIADIEDDYYERADKIEDFEVRLEKNDIIIGRQAILWRLKSLDALRPIS